MPAGKSKEISRIDQAMQHASEHLAHRRYFDAERVCVEALGRALAAENYEQMARILLPLQECRRQKRDLALDAGEVFRVNTELPAGKSIRPGCYLVEPPRVGIDGRLLREEADRRKVPAIIVVREPVTREGKWPIVALGPVTIRTRVSPPEEKPAPKRRSKSDASEADPGAGAALTPLPPPEWFIRANEALGDAAIAQVDPALPASSRVQPLLDRLYTHPDHEKLHQALEEACREAARAGPAAPRARRSIKPAVPQLEEDAV